MKKSNLVKSLTRVINNSKGLLILCLITSVLGVNDAWGNTYTAKLTVSSANTAQGKVYVYDGSEKKSSASLQESSSGDRTFSLSVEPQAGYHFNEWTNKTNIKSISETQAVVTANKKDGTVEASATATFAANTDTKYTVKHYQENVDGSYPANATETDNLTGTTDTKVTPNRKSYTGFTAPAGQELTIKGDGSASVSYNYTRNSYTLTWNLDGGSITTAGTPAGSVKYGATLTVPTVSKVGAQFKGWSPEVPATMPAENVTYTALWVSKYDFEMSGEDRSMKVDEELPNAFAFTHAENPEAHISNTNIITYDAANNKLVAHQEGTATIYFTQAETTNIYAGTSDTYTITVSKIANTLTADATHSMKVDETWNNVYSNKNSDATITTESTDASVAYFDVTNNKIVAPNSSAKSFNSKEVTITISQAATYKYTAAEKTITVMVKKHVPTFTWSNATLYHNQSYNDFFTTNGTNALTVKSSSDDNVAYLVDGANAQKLNLKTLSKVASTTLTVTQAENYYWAEHTESKTITPKTVANHVPFTVTEEMYDALNDGTAGAQSWDNGIRVGDLGGGFNYDDKYREFGPFNGIPDKLSCSYTCSDAATRRGWRVYQSADGSNWGEPIINTDKEGSANNIQLAPTTRYLKFVYSGNFAGYFQNITVTELKTFSTDKSSLDFGSNKKDITCASQTFTFNYANVGHKVTLTTNDPHFTVSPTSITNIGGEKYGSQTITVSYSTIEVHSASNAKLTIKDELGNSKEITLSGSTAKKTQTISWVSPYDVEEPAIPIGKTITGAATSSAISLDITYESSDETIIEIAEDGKSFKAVKEGSATITAKQVGTDDWEEASISKVFKTTNKIIQVISWNQNFTRLLTTYGAQDLTARVNLEDAQTGVQTWSKERSDLITYTSQNSSVVSVSGSTLTIVGVGETTLTATAPGDDLYESATVTIPVKVRVPSAGCEDVLLTTDLSNSEYEFHRDIDTKEITKIVQIDRTSTAYPGAVTFQHRGKKSWGFYDGEIEVYESVDGGANYKTLVGHIKPNESSEYGISTFSINRNTTHLKFYRPSGSTGYHYIKNVEVIPAQFIEANAADNTIDFGNVTVNSVEERTIVLSYANVKDNLTITKSSDDLTLSCGDIIDLDCGATGTNTITITFTPKAVGDFSDDITFFDKNSKQNYTLNIKAKVVKSTQHITWEPTQTEYRTIDQIVLNAIASSTYPVKYYVKEGTDVADFENGVLIIKKDGQITIRAYEPGDAIYEAAADVDKIFTIRKTNLHFDPLPTAATITYPQTLSESALTDGVVKDEEGNVVAGTIAWTTPTTQLNAGENQSQEITFTPTTNPAWYNALSSSVSVTVLKANPSATASAGDITYGQKVNESVLTNSGTEGTWTWTDTRKDDVLAAGTYEGLKVHFTPTDPTNYNGIEGTVSLTITAATPTLTWTATPEAAQVHETKTLTASSTNTDNTAAITYSIISGSECAIINETTGEVTMTKAGTITVQASQVATTNFNAPEPIETTCTISLAPTSITTKPSTDNIVSGTSLSEVVLTGGEAQNTINNQAVEGTFAVIGGETTAVGEQTLTITFAPTEADKYASCTTTISATVIQRTPTQEEVGTPSAADIEYGAAVNTSVLTGNGTLDGTWSWIDNRKDDVLPVGTHDGLQVLFTPTDGNVRTVDAVVSLTITGEMENKFTGDGDWNEASNWTNGIPTGENPNVVISGSLTISNPISVGGLTIENTGKVNIVEDGDLTVNGTSAERETYGNLFVRNGGNITINENAGVKVYDFVVESSIGTQNGTSVSGQVENSNKVIYTNGAYIDINMDPDGSMDDTQWYGFTVPFPVDVQNGVARKEGETFLKCTYGSDYMIAEYDMNQRLNTGKGWKYIKTGQLQPGHFYYLTVNGNYNTYSFKAAETTFTIQTETAITTNGDGANANWNAVGNSTLMYAEVSGENLPNYVQTYVNGESRYQVVSTTDAQFVVGCPFFIQATKATTMVLNKATEMQNILHYAPRSEETAQPICVRIAEEGLRFSDQMYITASEDALDTYELGRDLAKAGIGTKSAQLWVNAYKQSLCVNDAPLIDKKAYYDVTLYAPKAGSYEISLPRIPNNGTLYLTQNGMPMWNLNESAYSIECAKGNNSEYGLLFIESEPSGDGSMTNNPTLNDNNQWQKVLVNQHVYILQNGSVYDITGQKVK